MMNAMETPSKITTLMIVDDHPLVRAGIKALVQLEPDLDVTCEAEDHESALKIMAEHNPDLVLVDLSLKNSNGLNLLKAIAQQEGPLMVVAFDSTDPTPWRLLKNRKPRTPYGRRKSRIRKARPQGGKYVQTAYWTNFISDEEVQEIDLVSPAYRPSESVNTNSHYPRWRRLRSLDWTLPMGLGGFPIRYTTSTCNSDQEVNDPTTVYCQDGNPRYTEGLSFDLGVLMTWWVIDDRRLALEIGPEVRLDLTKGGESLFWSEYDDIATAWMMRPQFGVMGGIRKAPDPTPLWRWTRNSMPWGAESPDGSSNLRRYEYGLRAGFLTGPGYNGLEATAATELWLGWSIRRKRSLKASFTPYHPGFILGPFVRGQYEWTLMAEEARLRELDYSLTAIIGFRGQLRMSSGDVALPEG